MVKSSQQQQFFTGRIFSGLLLIFLLVLAIVLANTPLKQFYDGLVDLPVQIGVGEFVAKKPLLLWVNEGLMAIFFMLLSVEIKREIIAGDLSKRSQLVLPVLGAIGGIVLPVIIYTILNAHHALKLRGWPIATTTDIAFALSVVALLGKRVPASLKAFLIALSIVDDILAIAIIALFYSHDLSLLTLSLSVICILLLVILNLLGVKRLAAYMIIGTIIWALVLKSGIHATLAGVAVGLTIPYQENARGRSPLMQLEHSLYPWVMFGVLPLFVFINGGISFASFSWAAFSNTVVLGVALGLLLGKSVGGFIVAWLLVKFKFAKLPNHANWRQLLGLFFLTGIGFTMSLFIAALAFTGTAFEEYSRQGVLLGSLVAVVMGIICFTLPDIRSFVFKYKS